jgi:hypothetical protein
MRLWKLRTSGSDVHNCATGTSGERRAYFVHDADVNELEIDVEHLIAAVGVYVNFNHGLHAATSRNINVHELRLTAR